MDNRGARMAVQIDASPVLRYRSQHGVFSSERVCRLGRGRNGTFFTADYADYWITQIGTYGVLVHEVGTTVSFHSVEPGQCQIPFEREVEVPVS